MLRNRLKVRQLSLLATLASAPSLHKAAEQLGMSQPAATRMLHELEEMLCVPLFERTNRGLIATDAGQLLMRHATAFVAGIDKIYEDARSLKSGLSGSVRVGVASGARPDIVPRALLALKQQVPHLYVQLNDGAQAHLIADLRRGLLDLVVGRAPALDPENPLHFQALYEESFVVVTGTSAGSARVRAQDVFADLVDHGWLLPPADTALRKTVENLFVAASGRLPLNVIDTVACVGNIALLNMSGYLALLPTSVAAFHAARKQLHILSDPLPHLSGTVGMIHLPDGPHAAAVVRFATLVREQTRSPGDL